LIEEAAIRRYAGENRVDIAVARQEVILTILLDRIFVHPHLRDALALKGGTALRKLVFGSSGRFSEDMDFATLGDDNDAIQAELIALLVNDEAGERDGVHVLEFDFEQSMQGTIQAVCEFQSERGGGRFELDITGGDDRRPLFATIWQRPLHQSYFRQLGFDPAPIRRVETVEMITEKVVAVHRRFENGNPKDIWDLWKWIHLPTARDESDLVRRLWPIRLWLDGQHWRGPGWFNRVEEFAFDWGRLRAMMPQGRIDGQMIVRELRNRLSPWIDRDEQRLLADAGVGRLRTTAMEQLGLLREAVER
jgi:predicted nucleotidyltransferase component of viral defense system